MAEATSIMFYRYFYSPQGHPYNCFPRGLMYIYIYIQMYMFVSLMQICVVYVVKEVASFWGRGEGHVKECSLELHTSKQFLITITQKGRERH